MSDRRLLPDIEIANEGGAELLVLERRDVPLVAGRLICRRAAAEPASLCAVRGLAADLVNQGPGTMTPQEWRATLERDALVVTVHTSPTTWWLSFGCLREDLDACVAHARELLAGPALPRSEWRPLVARWRAGTKERFAQPGWLVNPLSSRQAMGAGHPFAQVVTPRAVRRARFAELAPIARDAFESVAMLQAYVGGDVSTSEGMDLLRSLCAAVGKPGGDSPPAPELEPSRRPVWILDSRKSTQAFFALSGRPLRAPEEDRVALRVANHIIGGGGFTARLMDRVRSEMGHTYGIGSHLPEEHVELPYVIHSFTRAANLGRVLKVIHDVLEDLVSSGVRPEELEAARDHLYGALPLRMDSPGAILGYVAKWNMLGVNVEALEADWRALRDVDAAQVNAAVERLVGDGAFRIAAVGPAKALRSQLEPFGEVAVFSQGSDPESWRD